MIPERLSVKFFAHEPGEIDLSKFVAIYQSWIQNHTVEGLLIDAADYKHVPNGPGVLLIGHEGDYSFDMGDGRPGVMYTRKRMRPDNLQDYLVLVFRLVLSAAKEMETDKRLNGVKFDYSEARITFLDRLNTPNTPESLAALQGELSSFLSQLYESDTIIIASAHSDPRECLAVTVKAEAVNAEILLERLQALQPAAG
ncbi:MAG TPA: hypothetical protein VJZ27_10830 [Aggregatilineales bacterium]|nr:hypothetical protein [Aggregatilineales bacterium]